MGDSSVASLPQNDINRTTQNYSERRAGSDKEDMRATNRMDRYRVRWDELVV